MVVVIILGVLTAMIVPQFAGSYQAALLRAAARELVTVVRLASSQAVTQNRSVRLIIEEQKNRYWLEGRNRDATAGGPMYVPLRDLPGASGELNEHLLVRVTPYGAAASRPSSPRGPGRADPPRAGRGSRGEGRGIAFEPDGTAAAREITLRDREGFGVGLRIHPTTARVRVVSLEPEWRIAP